MRCNLITDLGNQAGLAVDVELLGAFLRGLGHVVEVAHWQSRSQPADVNFYLERFDPRHLFTANKHIGVFNLEWFREEWIIYLDRLTQIWAKSAVAHEWFMEHGFDQVRFTGFLSRDPLIAGVTKTRSAVHVAGRSLAKGTATVLQAYRDAALMGVDLPLLSLVTHAPIEPLPSNVVQCGLACPRSVVDTLLNTNRFHLCPSEVEGWGTCITEATACGGIVITTDASPMNEHVLPTFGRLLTPTSIKRVGLVDRCFVSSQQIIEALLELNGLSDIELDAMGVKARAWNHRRNHAFETTAAMLLKDLA